MMRAEEAYAASSAACEVQDKNDLTVIEAEIKAAAERGDYRAVITPARRFSEHTLSTLTRLGYKVAGPRDSDPQYRVHISWAEAASGSPQPTPNAREGQYVIRRRSTRKRVPPLTDSVGYWLGGSSWGAQPPGDDCASGDMQFMSLSLAEAVARHMADVRDDGETRYGFVFEVVDAQTLAVAP